MLEIIDFHVTYDSTSGEMHIENLISKEFDCIIGFAVKS